MSLAWPNQWFPLTLACSGRLAKSTLSLFRRSDRFDFVFAEGSHYANRTFYEFFVLRIISGPKVMFVQ